MKVHILSIGDEILIGQITNTNSSWMARLLNNNSIRVQGISTVSDQHEEIIEGIKTAFLKSDVILMTGGLGPTKDDVTKKAIADYYGVGLVFSSPTYERILKMFEQWGRKTTDAHREQCYMPQNTVLLFNKLGTAPGMWFDEAGKVLVAMPGIPYEMEYLMEHQVLPKLLERFPRSPIAHRTIQTVGEGESRIAERIAKFEDNLPPYIKLAYLPNMGRVRLRLTAFGDNQTTIEAALDEKVQELVPLIDDLIFGHGDISLEAAIGQLLQTRNLTIATAESCTGGYLAHQITSVAGSSAYYMGSVIAYSNDVKINQLNVRPATLKEHGAVSEATVREMVAGLLQLIPADIGIAISGVAGPDGGTPEKPVGTIWLAIGNQEQIYSRKLQLGKDRLRNIQFTSINALNFIREWVLGRLQD